MSNQAAISRINGAQSNGPITAEGKAKSAQNSLKHGLTGSRIVLPHESQEDYDELEASFINRFKPADPLEMELVHEMAASRWRLRRIEAMESALFTKAIRQQREVLGPDADESEVQLSAYADVAESKPYGVLVRHSAQLRRAYEKAGKELKAIQEQRLLDQADTQDAEIQNEPRRAAEGRDLDRLIHVAMTMPPPGGFKNGGGQTAYLNSAV